MLFAGARVTRLARGNLITLCHVLEHLCVDQKSIILLQELNLRAQGEVIIRDALRELEMWGAGAVFQLTDYEDSHKAKVQLIKEWKELVTQVRIILSQSVVLSVCRKRLSVWLLSNIM